MASTTLRIHPEVESLIKPIISDMTRINYTQKTNPLVGPHNEPEAFKEIKKTCVHIINENGEYRLATHKNSEGKLVCEACGRIIGSKFDRTSIDKIMDCIEVINQILLFGILNGLKAAPCASLIELKKNLPAAAQLLEELNKFVSQDNTASESIDSVAREYVINNINPITSMR